MATTQYSFADVIMVISHPSFGQYSASGAGIGSITVTMSTDRTAQDVAADGQVMVSKVEGKNGNFALNIQQTSGLNKWLVNLYNFLDNADPSLWAEAIINIRSRLLQDLIYATGVAIQKLPDRPYQADGQKVDWTLMAADIDQIIV